MATGGRSVSFWVHFQFRSNREHPLPLTRPFMAKTNYSQNKGVGEIQTLSRIQNLKERFCHGYTMWNRAFYCPYVSLFVRTKDFLSVCFSRVKHHQIPSSQLVQQCNAVDINLKLATQHVYSQETSHKSKSIRIAVEAASFYTLMIFSPIIRFPSQTTLRIFHSSLPRGSLVGGSLSVRSQIVLNNQPKTIHSMIFRWFEPWSIHYV